MAESEEELKTFLMKLKEENEKPGLKLNIQKMKIMVSDPITLWQIHGETKETQTIFLGSKITADGDYNCEIERCLLLGRKAMTNLMAESEEELKNLLMKVKEESEKAGFKLNIQKLRSWHPMSSLQGRQMGQKWKQ